MKFIVVIKNLSHMTRMMKSKILSIFLRLSVTNMLKNIRHIVYGSVSEMDNILQILHQMINEQNITNYELLQVFFEHVLD